MATSAAQIAKTGKFGDLRRRLVFLLLALVVYRIGAHIPVQHVLGWRAFSLHGLRSGDHAVHFGIDHHAADDLRGSHV